jgi:hypothetical protein
MIPATRTLAASIAAIVLTACQTSAPIIAPAPTSNRADTGAAPILQSVTMRTNVSDGIGTVSVVPDFHFIAPNGNAIVLRRELVDTNGPFAQTQIRSETINTPAAAQKTGAVLSGGWRCGVAQYYITLRAYIMDADGNRSNSVQYTIHCNGG